MLRALLLAFAQLFTGPILRLLGLCTLLSLACFVGLWFGIDWTLEHFWGDPAQSDSWLIALGWLLTLLLVWFLFPVVASMFVALFLEYVANVVERQHYPHLPKATGLSFGHAVVVSLRFVGVLILANVLLLLLLFFPPAYGVAWFLVNGWLIGREYFELVAMRRVSPRDADALRRRNGGECLVTGMAIAFLMTLPLVNLVIPVFATAVMVHRYHDWQGTRVAPRDGEPPALPKA